MAMNLEAFTRFAKVFQDGEMIFSEFEPGDAFYLIQSGQVKLVKLIGDVEKTIDILQPSDMFGEMAILENTPRSATAIAMETVTLLEFNRQNFEILMRGNPQVALKLLRSFAKRIYDQKKRFTILTIKDPSAKIAAVLLVLDEMQPNSETRTDHREFAATIEDIAHWAGMSVTKTKDAMTNFVNQHQLEIYADKIIAKNINVFVRIVNANKRW